MVNLLLELIETGTQMAPNAGGIAEFTGEGTM
jgi:hypothetical protein